MEDGIASMYCYRVEEAKRRLVDPALQHYSILAILVRDLRHRLGDLPRLSSGLSTHYSAWRGARAELNELPVGAAAWKE
jgi:hypothetical protein